MPTVKGRHTYTVRIPAVPEEKIVENNRRSAVVQVVDSKIRVLYIEGTLRAEYGALVQRFLSKDPDLEFCALVQTRPNVFVRRTNMEGPQAERAAHRCGRRLEKFDVILLGDIDSTYWKPEADGTCGQAGARRCGAAGHRRLSQPGARRLRGNAAARRSCRSSPGIATIGQITDPFLPVLTPAGRDHPIFANIGKFFPTSGPRRHRSRGCRRWTVASG